MTEYSNTILITAKLTDQPTTNNSTSNTTFQTNNISEP